MLENEITDAILGAKFGQRDQILIIHSAFGGLSHQGVRAETFLAALVDRLGESTLLMPVMTWRTVTPAQPIFDELATPSHTGILTELFRTTIATHRSLHPTHSVAGLGHLAPHLLSTHHQGTTPCAGNSPYGLIRDWDTHILLLGVSLDSCTAIHHAEETIAPEIYVKPLPEAEAYDLIDRTGKIHKVLTRRHRRLPRDFAALTPELLSQEGAIAGSIGPTPWTLVSAKALYRTVFAKLIACPTALLNEES